MYKSPLDNFNDFYNQVFEKEAVSKQNNSKVEKSYFEYKNNQVYLRIKHDAINHGDKKHRLSAEEWKNVLENILNIENAAISNKQYSNDNVALIKVATPNGKYGVSIQFANGTNQISTIFKSTDKGIDSWIKKGSANSSTSEPLTSRDNSHTVAVVGQNHNDIIAYIKEQLNPSRQDVYRTQNIQDNFGQSVEELQEMFSEDIKNILAENEINSDEFEIEDVRLYGSYTTGKNKDTSDLDVIVQYKGSMKEDTAFNLLNDAKLTITDVNGIERKIDINPINSRLSGSIDEHIERMQEIDGAYFQSAVTAGAETSAEISDAQKEWQEKGTDSKYLKKWFGDSKVVDENGQPLVVYHGTESNEAFSVFETNSPDGTPAIYFSSNKKVANSYSGNLPIYEVYLKMENPLEVDAQGKEYNDFAAEMRSNIDYANRNGYDGVIVKNIRDDWSQEKGGKVATTYVVFNPEQIKSVDNRGTFDEGNPNIYYQSAYHGSPAKFDKFDHDYIGSGEGAQIHGYGTYVAESKHIADERYRKRLTNDDFNNEKYYYDNQLIDDRNKKAILATIVENGKDKVISVREKCLEKYKYSDEEYQRKKEELAWAKTLDENKIEKKTDRGQLYEVEIPEDEEMLDEDLPLSKQPQKVQDAFGEMIKADQNGQLILLDSDMDENETPITSLSVGEIVSENPNGKKIYDRISSTIADVYGVDYAEADKLASELLNRYGIKGIKYNGQTDGQCYVIFNPENIDITRTFYQGGIKNSENINIDKEDYINAEKDIPLPNINHQVLKNLGKKDKPLILKSNIIKKNKKNHPEILIEEYNDILSKGLQSTDLVFKTDNKNEYYNFIHFDNATNEQILIELSENKDNYEIVNFYKFSDKSLERKIKKANNEGGQFLITDSNAKGAAVLSALEVSPNNIITINSTNNKPKRTGYVFQEPAQPNLFVENASQNHDKGFVGIDLKANRGLTDINRNLILIGTTGDVTTVLHESAHYFLNMLEELERVPDHSPKVDDVLFAIRKTLKNDGTPFTRSQHEKFAKGFEHYIYTGNARSNIFKEIYEDIKNLLKNIYEFVQKGQYFTTGEGALTEEEMKNFNNVFDEIFKLENKTVKERVFAKVLALNEKEEDGFFKELTLFLSLFW